jgi:mannose-6-phosphate isomerase-like protein (cupin superfamily)
MLLIDQPLESLRVFRIQPGDSNKFALLVDPIEHGAGFVQVLEIFDEGGSTPPNVHAAADEAFFVLHGRGEAHAEGLVRSIGPGSTLLVRAGAAHRILNTGPGRLYCLTTMVPNEGFAELIRAGTPDRLDDQDRAVLGATGR